MNAGHNKPLVSILIPAFKPEYFELALCSALAQTYRPIEIIVGDDSGDEVIRDICKRYPDIKYFSNTSPSLVNNINHLIRKAQGKAIKFLLDDDLLHPFCVDMMIRILDNLPGVSLVTSVRGILDKHNVKYDSVGLVSAKNEDEDLLLKGDVATQKALVMIKNIFGELSTYMFRKKHMDELAQEGLGNFETFGEINLQGLRDLTLVLKLCQKGDVYFMHDELSYFRKHENSITGKRGEGFLNNLVAWKPLLDEAFRQKMIQHQPYLTAQRKLLLIFRKYAQEFPALKEHAQEIEGILSV